MKLTPEQKSYIKLGQAIQKTINLRTAINYYESVGDLANSESARSLIPSSVRAAKARWEECKTVSQMEKSCYNCERCKEYCKSLGETTLNCTIGNIDIYTIHEFPSDFSCNYWIPEKSCRDCEHFYEEMGINPPVLFPCCQKADKGYGPDNNWPVIEDICYAKRCRKFEERKEAN